MHEQGSFAAAIICSSARVLAASIVDRQLTRAPETAEAYGRGPRDLAMDTEVRLGYLAEALAADRPTLFTEQLRWLKVLCAARGVSDEDLQLNLTCMSEELTARLPEQAAKLVTPLLVLASEHLANAPSTTPSHLEAEAPHINTARQFLLAVLEAREQDAVQLLMAAYAGGTSIAELHEHVLCKVQREIGRMWQMGEANIAEEHLCTGIVTTVMALMRANAPRAKPNGRRVITATVSNETHALGIQLVTQAFEAEGWNVISLGVDTPAGAIADAARDFGCDAIALSVNIVLYVRQTAELIAALRAHPTTANIPILVGGQPFNLVDDLWQVVGADGYARTAMSSPAVAAKLVNDRATRK
jgi:MerR family transcriptional regulator, light-induced transcriptional regulator